MACRTVFASAVATERPRQHAGTPSLRTATPASRCMEKGGHRQGSCALHHLQPPHMIHSIHASPSAISARSGSEEIPRRERVCAYERRVCDYFNVCGGIKNHDTPVLKTKNRTWYAPFPLSSQKIMVCGNGMTSFRSGRENFTTPPARKMNFKLSSFMSSSRKKTLSRRFFWVF